MQKNQDSLIMHLDEASGNLMMSVFDGHGEAGDLVSQHFRAKFPTAVFGDADSKKGPEGANLAQAKYFISLEAELLNDGSIDTDFSGTTAVSSIIFPKERKLATANAGDSRVILGELDAATGKLVAREISIDHKPDSPEEKKRILAAGGRVFAVQYEDGVDGPARVWLSNMDIPGLAMARSLCDAVAHQAGVISEAECFVHDLLPTTKVLITASDGLWEFIENQEVLDLIQHCVADAKADEALKILVAESKKRWMTEEQVVDDTTIGIVFFNIPE